MYLMAALNKAPQHSKRSLLKPAPEPTAEARTQAHPTGDGNDDTHHGWQCAALNWAQDINHYSTHC